MKNENSKYYKDWFGKAEQDWKRSKILLKVKDTEGAGLHLQQAIEKYLKGYLIFKGWKLQRIHDLEKLLNIAIGFSHELEEFWPICEQITEYYMISRYPIFTNYIPIVDEIKEAQNIAERLIGVLKKL